MLPVAQGTATIGAVGLGIRILHHLVHGHGAQLIRNLYDAIVLAILMAVLTHDKAESMLCNQSFREQWMRTAH